MNITYNHKSPDLDQEWITEYKTSGDLAALGRLYEPYIPLVYGVALKYLKDEERSKDAVMQIFEKLISKIKLHRIDYFKSWLYTLSKNHCLMELRQDKTKAVILEDDFVDFAPFMHLTEKEQTEAQLMAMEACLEALNTEQRKSITLFYLDEKCYAEVAQETGYELKKVKSYIQNGKRNLKICIEQQSE